MNLRILYACVMAQLAGAALLAGALFGAVALGWPDGPVSFAGAVGLAIVGLAGIVFDSYFPEL